MRPFSIVCIVIGAVELSVAVFAQQPPAASYEDLVAWLAIGSVFLIALGITGVATTGSAKKANAVKAEPSVPLVAAPSVRQPGRYCRNCGALAIENASFCGGCGGPIA